MKTADVNAALRARFCAPEWSIFFEVADATGARHNRWADAIAINLYPSRGLEIHGFEVKVSRSDWLRELKAPDKSDAVQRYCDRWWIVAPADIIKPGELPPTWGQYEVSSSAKLRQIIAAPKLESTPVNRAFVAAMLRRAGEVDQSVVEAAVQRRVAELREGDDKRMAREIEFKTRQASELTEAVAEVERISGVKITNWNSEKIGLAVRAVMEAGVLGTYTNLTYMRDQAKTLLQHVDNALALFPSEKAETECNT